MNILKASLKNNVGKLIHTSTSEVYGTALYTPIDENHPLSPQSPYAASKIAADKLAESFYKSYNLPIVILRPFNTFGPRQSLRAIIPTIIMQLLKNRKLTVGNLKPSRDFTFVKDVVRANLAALNSKNCGGEVFNVSEGKSITINFLAQRINELMQKKIKPEYYPPRAGDVFKSLGCPEKSKEKLNFQCIHNFDDSLKETIRWFTNAN